MSIFDVLEIGLEVGIEVLKGEKSIIEGIDSVYEQENERKIKIDF